MYLYVKLSIILEETFNTFLRYGDTLNPNIWTQNQTLKVTIRNHLLKIIDDFKEFVDVPLPIKDIILIGSSCDYSFGPKSDIDIHIILNLKQNTKEYKLLLNAQNEWKYLRNVKIKNHSVEIYLQASDELMTKNAATFSLQRNKWIHRPVHNQDAKYEMKDPEVIKIAKHYIAKINHFLTQTTPKLEDMSELKDEIKKLRKQGLMKDGEYSVENLAYKVIRNNNYLTKLIDKMHKIESNDLSL